MKPAMRKMVYAKYDGHCAYCGREITFKEMQVDHYWPQWNGMFAYKLGGFDVNSINNLMPSCRRRNHYKRASLPEDFRAMMKTLHERIRKIYIAKVAEDYGIIVIQPFDGVFYFEKYNQTTKKCHHPVEAVIMEGGEPAQCLRCGERIDVTRPNENSR